MSFHRLAACTSACFLATSMFSHTVALRLLLLVGTAALLAVAAARDRTIARFLSPFWFAYAVWAAWAGLSLAWSIDVERSVKEFRNEILYAALALWSCFAAAQARGAARLILPIAALGAAAAGGVALYTYSLGWERYLTGWHGGPGDHSSALLVFMPCALMAGWYGMRNNWSRNQLALGAALVGLFLAAGYTTQNRTVWLGFGVELLVMLALLLGLRSKEAPALALRTKVVLALTGLAVVAGAVAATVAVHRERTALNTVRALERDPRLALWSEVVERIQERPLIGYGFGRGSLRASLRDELGDHQLWHAHNLFLDTALQLGIPGVVLLFVLLAATLREAWRLCRSKPDAAMACGVALAAVVAGMLVRNTTDMLWVRQNALLYWGTVGVLLGLGTRSRAPARGQ